MKAYTNLEQSKKLAEILPIESADMFYTSLNRDYPWIWIDKHLMEVDDIPCWSLAALLDVIPSGKALIHDKENRGYKCICNNIDTYFYDNPIDACMKMVELLHKENLI